MDKFGDVWHDHENKIKKGWSEISNNDIVIIAGDILWNTNINKAKPEFDFIESLPGKKIITLGNHDYWFQSITKTNNFLFDNYKTIVCLTSNDYFNLFNKVAISSVKGYMNETHPEFKEDYRKSYNRQCIKLENTLKIIPSIFNTKIVVSHYPPIHKSYNDGNNQIIKIMKKYSVNTCIFGHLHGNEVNDKFEGIYEDIEFIFVSCDSFNFKPVLLYNIKD